MAKIAAMAMLVVFSVMLVVAQERPLLIQPQDAGLSAAERTSLEAAIQQLQRTLRSHDLGTRKRLGEWGWNAAQFAAYTAGSLERLGYVAVVVSAQAGAQDPLRAWVAVRVELGGGRTAWIPVEPAPGNPDLPQGRWGEVPLAEGPTLAYQGAYLAYDDVIEFPPNRPPTAVVDAMSDRVVEGRLYTWSANGSTDPDGEIVLYHWTFGSDVRRAVQGPTIGYLFHASGQYTVSLVVTDMRGAQGATQVVIDVIGREDVRAAPCKACRE